MLKVRLSWSNPISKKKAIDNKCWLNNGLHLKTLLFNSLKMEDKVKIRNSKIFEIFGTMEYGKNLEQAKKAIDWFGTKQNSFFTYVEKSTEAPVGIPKSFHNCVTGELLYKIYVPEIETIKNVLIKSTEKNKWIDINTFQRTKILNKLASEIEKNIDFFAQIECVTRGILSRDTQKKAVLLLAQYFRYYSVIAFNFREDYPKWKPKGIAVGVISNENCLSNLGLFLAPALAAGYNLILHVGTKLAPAALLIQDLATAAGMPEEVLRLVPSDDGELLPYLNSDKVAILSLFVDLQSQKYRGINNSGKKILHLSSYKTPVIVFESADLDSACVSIIQSSWAYQSLLPWSTNTVLVQENVFPIFLNKLKTKLKSLKFGKASDKMVDIVIGNESCSNKLSLLVNQAKSQGIEIFQAVEDSNDWCPTLFIGGRVQMNSVLTSDNQDANEVTVLAFRSIDEAVNLANNNRQGLGASLWSENIGVINEVTRKLKVANVWVNSSYGSSTAAAAICPLKDSGVGYFGGREGFLEYVEFGSKSGVSICSASDTSISAAGVIASAKKSQDGWSRVPKIKKCRIFQEYAEYLDTQKINNSNLSDWITTTISNIYESLKDSYRETPNITSAYSLNTLTEPRGVVAIDISQSDNRKLIFTALYQGNTVIVLSKSTCSSDLLKKLCSFLPSGVLSTLPYSLEAVKSIALNNLVNVYFGNDINPVFACLPLANSTMFTKVSDEWSDIYRKVTVLKNIWCDIGKSSTCN